MYFKIREDKEGEYRKQNGTRYSLQWCRRVRPADGWAVFETPDDCLAAWGLTYEPLPAPAEFPPN